MKIRIRPYGKSDKDGLIACLHALAETYFPDSDRFGDWIYARYMIGIKTFVAADESRRVVGTASAFVYPTLLHGGRNAVHVEDVAVLPEVQGQGVGRALVEHCLDFARNVDAYKVVLNCDPRNVPFYEKCGFRLTPDGFMRRDL